jgi:hypothetical protein
MLSSRMFRRSSLPISRPVASSPSWCAFPDLFPGASFAPVPKPNTVVRLPKIAKHRKISTYVKRACNSRRISTYIFSALKSLWNQHLQKNREGTCAFWRPPSGGPSNLIIGIVERQKGVPRAKVHAANVYQQDELRGVKEVIRSFRALTKSTPPLGGPGPGEGSATHDK